MKHSILLIIMCVLVGLSASAQSTATEAKTAKRITITTKKVDDNGKTITETYIAEGNEPSKILEGMAISPESMQRVEIVNGNEATQERLFLYRNAGDKVTIEGTLNESPNANDEQRIYETVIINNNAVKNGKESYRIVTPNENTQVWVRSHGGDNNKSNCAALGVYVTTSDAGGSRINSVIENGGAQAAGLKSGDIITRINEHDVTEFATLHAALSHFTPGDVVTVRYNRDGKNQKSKVELKDWRDLPGHEWRSRSDCAKQPVAEEDEKLTLDDPDQLSNSLELELENALIFPNPTEGLFAFSFKTAPGPLSVAITDVNGKVVYQENNDNPEGYYKKEIDLKGLPQGNYIVTVTQGEKIFTEQISKQ